MAFKDVVVLLPGITGSVLANAQGKEIWSPSAGAIWRAITSFGDSIEDGLALDAPGITAPRLVPDTTIVPGLVKIDGYTRIEQYLVAQLGLEKGRNYFAFPYDWRLDNRVNAKRLESQALGWLHAWREHGGAKDSKLVLVGHSMGGLVSRYFVECLGGWPHTRTLVTLGTPHRGSLNAVGFLVHGMKKGIGPLGLDLSALLRSYPSVYQLLPTYPCIDTGAGALARVAAAARAGALPHVKPEAAADARAFHQEIEDAQTRNATDEAYRERGCRVVPVVGIEQPTMQSARAVAGGAVELLRSHGGQDLGGDGTVPRVSATPLELSDAEREVYAADTHGSLQNADGVLAQIKGVGTRPSIDLSNYRAELPTALSLDLESDAIGAVEPLVLRARASEGNPAIRARLTHVASGRTLPDEPLARDRTRAGWQVAEFGALEPGAWRVRIEADGATPVTDLALVVAP